MAFQKCQPYVLVNYTHQNISNKYSLHKKKHIVAKSNLYLKKHQQDSTLNSMTSKRPLGSSEKC